MNTPKLLFLVACCMWVGAPLCADVVKSSAPTHEDANTMFDGIDDALDHVIIGDHGCGTIADSLGQPPTVLQMYYQSALLYILSSYVTAKKYLLSWWSHPVVTPKV